MPVDKVKHFLAGVLIFTFCFILGSNHWFSMVMVIIAGVGKEVYDYYHPQQHTVEVLDLLATIAGGIVVCLGLLLI
ncbi:hypothetical protein [Halanaerobacter jeridensis]|uniref:Uncharacterized protein n=1 Tax=Halanaerobacter jeridensis TaxID=706427 RepID=A0A938XVQ1_9FIRM|nr:hypothetical protein [Halanaerobacter jeridensis]MBM7556472.1 hypothetical protein [Halanaerobacter jeridensis]